MFEGTIKRLGTSRFLEWEALEASRSTGGVLVVRDKRSLELLDKEVGMFSISCRFKNVEYGLAWVFTRVYGLYPGMGGLSYGKNLGLLGGCGRTPGV